MKADLEGSMSLMTMGSRSRTEVRSRNGFICKNVLKITLKGCT